MFKRLFALVLLLSAVSYSAYGQDAEQYNVVPEAGMQIVSTGMLSWANGYQPIYYERLLSEKFSVRVGAGPSFRSFFNDFIAGLYQGHEDKDYETRASSIDFPTSVQLSDISISPVIDYYNDYKFRKAKIGYYISLSPKLNLNYKKGKGISIFPMIEYKYHKYNAQKIAPTFNMYSSMITGAPIDARFIGRTNDIQEEYDKCLDLTLNLGRTKTNRLKVAYSWNFGVGLRRLSSKRLLSYLVTDGTNHFFENFENVFKTYRPIITADLCVGLWR